MTHVHARRAFFKAAAHLSACAVPALATNPGLGLGLAGLGALAAGQAQAADTSGYKALVCLFMVGGNDSHNWVVPMDANGHSEYAAVRRELAVPLHQLQALSSTGQERGRSFGMPLQLAPLKALYEAGKCAVVANVGPLERPLTRAEYLAGVAVPRKLFSHNDQQSTWQSLAPEGATSGWGGRMGDVLMSANQHPVFTALSSSGNVVFLTGSQVSQYQINLTGPVGINAFDRTSLHGSADAFGQLRKSMVAGGTSPLMAEYAKAMQRSLDTNEVLRSALTAVPAVSLPIKMVAVPNAGSFRLDQDGLARQLRMVAHMISASQKLGMRRQVFMVQMGGFDTHAHQVRDQPMLMARVAHSAQWFMDAVAGLGLQNNVTLFTASDFGRTLTTNGSGCDHGWGAHHFVMGGAVKGRQILGRMPLTALGTEDDVGSGRLLPSTSVSQMAASLGHWMGLSSTELRHVLPNLGSFDAGMLPLM